MLFHMAAIRVVLVDDHAIVLHGLAALLERQSDIELAAACTDGVSALAAVRRLRPDVLVVDLAMPGMGGLDIIKTAMGDEIRCRCIVLTAAISDQEVFAAMKLGVAGLVLKESAPDSLVACIRCVGQGGQWIDQDTVARALQGAADRDAAERAAALLLTPRELEIVRMVAEGLRNKAIAERLQITEGTVKVHLHHIYEKLGVDGRLDLLVSAQQRGLL
jgi:DNA-binding NarL/FixJ family response regulator